jgi:hypothetical protein
LFTARSEDFESPPLLTVRISVRVFDYSWHCSFLPSHCLLHCWSFQFIAAPTPKFVTVGCPPLPHLPVTSSLYSTVPARIPVFVLLIVIDLSCSTLFQRHCSRRACPSPFPIPITCSFLSRPRPCSLPVLSLVLSSLHSPYIYVSFPTSVIVIVVTFSALSCRLCTLLIYVFFYNFCQCPCSLTVFSCPAYNCVSYTISVSVLVLYQSYPVL